MADFRHETARLVLRDWRDEDWPAFWQATNTPAVMRWLGGVSDASERAAAEARIRSYRDEHGHTFWALERRADGALLGFCGLKRSNQAGGPQGMMEIGWRLREDAWGQGYAREAATAAMDLAFDRFGADEVIALTVEGNAASWGLMLRLGMERRRELDFASPDFDPENPVIIVHAITREKWRSLRAAAA
jgi:RimJ/RimL family protein N-acetyltransferase